MIIDHTCGDIPLIERKHPKYMLKPMYYDLLHIIDFSHRDGQYIEKRISEELLDFVNKFIEKYNKDE